MVKFTFMEETTLNLEIETKEDRKLKRNLLLLALIFFSLMFICDIAFLKKYFHIYSFDQFLFHISMPLEGTDPKIVRKFLKYTFIYPLIPLALMLFLMDFYCRMKKKAKTRGGFERILSFCYRSHTRILLFGFLCVFLLMLFYTSHTLKVTRYIKQEIGGYSSFYEQHYVFPGKTKIKFEEKKNLILIYLESMEKTLFDREMFPSGLLTELEKLTKENLSFRGFKQLRGSEWTIGGIFSSMCGIPLKTIVHKNSYGRYKLFFPGAKCLPQILKENGYTNYYLQGASLTFAGKGKFLRQHGINNIYGRTYLNEYYNYDKRYHGNWGINDHGTYKFAKKKLLEISKEKNNKPFFFAMLTVDSHYPGFLNEKCDAPYESRVENIFLCGDRLIGDFISWIKKQDFYKDTKIVILADHLVMSDSVLHKKMAKYRNREIINIFLSSDGKFTGKFKPFGAIDLFPTIVEYAGGEIEGRKLGLGTSLFSDKKTLLEKYGFKKLNNYLYKKSNLYENLRYAKS